MSLVATPPPVKMKGKGERGHYMWYNAAGDPSYVLKYSEKHKRVGNRDVTSLKIMMNT